MTIETELYIEHLKRLPETGQHILGHQSEDHIVVYQAYKKSIADFAITHQFLGGNDFSYTRMSWIKPNFLWMMYRCGWAEKENQERVLALWISKSDFSEILKKAVYSSFNGLHYSNHEQWSKELNSSDVRLQWDPDYDPYGNKMQRRAIQLGMKGETLAKFGKNQIQRIEDITEFVKSQKQVLDRNQLNELCVPIENVLEDFNSSVI
ncbi:DUF4291 domain-containing protein [Pedobacter sp. GR22-6]|uniref:DUF4291 domain-containing protein n=1 Tax=Pedobacter sp. GR22-6 TaxID=3127957 RepID=UPI00307DBD93